MSRSSKYQVRKQYMATNDKRAKAALRGLDTTKAKGMILSFILFAATAGAQAIPADAKATCTVTPTAFAGWFQPGLCTQSALRALVPLE
jgi:hypothetical protein